MCEVNILIPFASFTFLHYKKCYHKNSSLYKRTKVEHMNVHY